MSAIGCVNDGRAGTADEVREYMSGNLCRCAAYPKIVEAVLQAALIPWWRSRPLTGSAWR